MRGKDFKKKMAVVAVAAMIGVTSLPLTVMASGLTDVTNDNSDPFKAASTGLVTTTLPTSMDDSVSDDGTVVSGSEKLKAFLTAYQAYDSMVESEVRRLDADSDAYMVTIRTWVGQSNLCPIYDKGKIIYQYAGYATTQDFDITSPTGNTDATAGSAEVPVVIEYTIGDNFNIFEQPLILHVKWGAGVYAASAKFTDVRDEDFFAEPIAWGVDRGIVCGTSATTFSPRANVTRAQFVTFLYRLTGSPDVTINKQFTDISGLSEEFQKAISWAAANGITYGKSDAVFAPNVTVKREEAVTFLFRYMQGKALDEGEKLIITSPFKDVKNGAYYADAIKWGVENYLVQGYDDDTFGVGRNTTRADAIAFISRTW